MLLVTEAPAPKTRLTSLDAVRGIAACVVVLAHCYLTIPEQRRAGLASLLWPRALGFLHNGDAAVVVFFVLSGYVLALPYFRGTQPSYPRYVIRRVCRIYIPFAASILFSLLLYNLTSHQHAPAASEWFNTLWPTASPGPAVLARHFLMIGTVPDIALNESMWTLVHEMRISLLFPLLMILCRDTRVAVISASVLLLASTSLLAAWAHSFYPVSVESFPVTLLWTVQIMPYFITGILLSKHREQLHAAWALMPSPLRFILLAAPIVILWVSHTFRHSFEAKMDVLYDLNAAILVVLAIEAPKVRAFLNQPIPQWLGRISYSLYLIHMPLMLALVPLLIDRMQFGFVIAAIIAASLTAATLMHNLVEAPAIKLGHRLTQRATPTTTSDPDEPGRLAIQSIHTDH